MVIINIKYDVSQTVTQQNIIIKKKITDKSEIKIWHQHKAINSIIGKNVFQCLHLLANSATKKSINTVIDIPSTKYQPITQGL